MSKKAKIIAAGASAALLLSSALVGCGAQDPMASVTGGGDNSNEENVLVLSQENISMVPGAENPMCNNALKLTVTDMQRRPLSTFANSSISTGGTGQGSTTSASTDDVVIEVDISYTWNINTYNAALASMGVQNANPSTLKDLLRPGTLMYIAGTDANGEPYIVADVIQPEKQENTNALAINYQWNYDILNTQLPEASKRQDGSMLFRCASTASNLKLYIITPMSGQAADDDNALLAGNVAQYTLDLT